MSALFLLLAAAFAPPPTTGIHSAEVDTMLARLVGDWAIQGLASNQFRQNCRWFGNRAFVLCNIDDKRNRSTGQVAFGYSTHERRYTYSLIDSTGGSKRQTGFASGEYGLVFIDEAADGRGPARIQTNLIVEHDGIHVTELRSIAGGDWQKANAYVLVPAKPASARRRR